MAYGLYDQAAELINGALESEPNDAALLSKLCEIYFVWGNRDAFVDAATNLNQAVGDSESSDWDKIVIMGQQIAGDHELFAGAGVAGATKAVDLSFEAEMDEAAELDMDFGDDEGGAADIVDLGAAEPDEGIDFEFEADDDPTAESLTLTAEMTQEEPTAEMMPEEPTEQMPSASDETGATPTIEEQFAGLDSTSELPSLDDAFAGSGRGSDETAEINLDELDLDVGGLEETDLAALDDLDATGRNEALEDPSDVTGKNPEIDPDATGVQRALDPDATGRQESVDPDATGLQEQLDPNTTAFREALDLDDDLDDDLDATGLRLAPACGWRRTRPVACRRPTGSRSWTGRSMPISWMRQARRRS
ncbi:MAG: hypothetical protein P8X94_03600 [Woeseiaceae bacterium]